MSARLATKVDQRQEEVWRLEAEVTRQRDEVAGFGRTWTVSLRFPLLSFSLESVVGLLTRSVCDLDRSR